MSQPVEPSSSNKNVLFLVEVINCNDGITTYCETLAAGLGKIGIDVYLVSGKIRSDEKSNRKRELLTAAVKKWYEFPTIRKIPSPSLLVRLSKLIKDHKIEVINAHGLGMLCWGRMLALMTGVRFVATYHPSVLGGIEKVLKAPTTKFSAKQVLFLNAFFPDRLVVLSEESRNFITQHKIIKKSRVVKAYSGTDLTHFYPPSESDRLRVREKYGLAEGDFMCLLLGRLAWVKGHDLLIKAVRKIRSDTGDASIKCFFVGSGGADREREIKSFAYAGDEKDNTAFKFLGYMGDVRDVLWAADTLVLPSRFEGFPLAVVEAMATGLVPIRTPAGGASDQIIDGKTGYIVPFEDVDALGNAIRNLTDFDRRKSMASKCMARAHELFGVGPMVDRMLSIYEISAV